MALINHATKEVTAKVVYYGPGLCGKTTNLQWIHDKVPVKNKGQMLSLATESDRTLFFDFLPVELGVVRGMKTRIQIYTVPGQVFYESTRRIVLKGADAVVFVADSQEAMLDANLESLQDLERNLIENGLDRDLPLVMQYNKRDLPTALPVELLNEKLNPRGVPCFEAVAIQGIGVEDTLKQITTLLFWSLTNMYAEPGSPVSAPPPPAAAPRAEAQPEEPSAPPAPEAEPPEAAPPRPPSVKAAAEPPAKPSAAAAESRAPETRAPGTEAPPKVVPPPRPPTTRRETPMPPKPVTPPASSPKLEPPPPLPSVRPAPPKPPAPPAEKPEPASAVEKQPAKSEPPAEVHASRAEPPPLPPPDKPKATPPAPPPVPRAEGPKVAPQAETQPARPRPPAAAVPPLRAEAPRVVPPPPAPPAQKPAAAAPRESPPAEPKAAPPATPPAPRTETQAKPPTPAPPTQKPAAAAPRESPPAQPKAAPPATPPAPRPEMPAQPPPRPAPALPAAPPPAEVAPRAAAGGGLAPSPEPMGPRWYYLLDGRKRGPFGLDDLIDLVLTEIPPETPVRGGGLSDWTPANQVPEIVEELPPSVPAAALGDAHPALPDFATVPETLRTVLVADENTAFRGFLSMPLRAQGFTIYEATDGLEAWKIVLQHRPWLILADANLPELDGFELCRRMRAHSLVSRTPLLFVSSSDNYKDRYRGMRAGADDFLSKHTPIRELLLRVQVLLTRYSDLATSAEKDKAGVARGMEGEIEVLGAPAVIQMCNQGLLTGILTADSGMVDAVRGGRLVAVFGFREGQIISASAGERTGPEAVYDFLAWTHGHFNFVPEDPGEGRPIARNVEQLLLEGCRRLDESRRDSGASPVVDPFA